MEVPTVKIRSSIPIINILDIFQRKRTEESCDTHIICQDGYIPCHKFILMANSKFLNQLILDNLNDIGHMDNKSIISLSFPEFKTRQMAHVISMFYTGKSICYLRDIFYIKRVMEVLGLKFNNPKKATRDEVSKFYRPLFFINECDSDTEEETKGSRFTTNVFSALRQTSSTNGPDQKTLKPTENGHLKSTITKEITKEIVTDQDTNTANIELPIPTTELFEPQNSTIDAPSKHKPPGNGSKEKLDVTEKIENRKTDQETENNETVPRNTSDSHRFIVRKEKSEGGITENKRKVADESDCEFDSADSALEIIRVRKRKLRKRTPKQQQENLNSPQLEKSRKGAGSKKSQITIKLEPIMREESEPDENATQGPVDLMCYFCLDTFTNEELLGTHLSLNCGKHLKGNYSIPSKMCDFCHKKFPLLNEWDFIHHVDSCYQTGKPIKQDSKAPTRKSFRIMEAAKKERNNSEESREALNSAAATDIEMSTIQTTDNTDVSDAVNLTMNNLLEEIHKDIEEFERENSNAQQTCNPSSENELLSSIAVALEEESQEYESNTNKLCSPSLSPSPKSDQLSNETPNTMYPLDIHSVVQRFRNKCFKGNSERNDVNGPSSSAVVMSQSAVVCPNTSSPQHIRFPALKIPGLTRSSASAKATPD